MVKVIVFTQSYFEGKVECDSIEEAKVIIHNYPLNHIRVQMGDYRLLLKPAKDGRTRQIEGFSDLADTYKYFNNITVSNLSQITIDDRGPGGTYISHVK